MANNNNMIRMSGMNSGLDTESIINALTANSKLKITKQNRQLLKYQATQEAYREIIDKMQSLKSKYFDILNSSSNLKGTSMWNKYATTTMVNGEEKKVSGFNVSTSIDSTPGTYTVKVLNTASQSTLTGSSLNSAANVDLSKFEADTSYGMSVTVGAETKNIIFEGGPNVVDNINNALTEAFGESNESLSDELAGAGTGDGARGLVYIDDSGNFVSREHKGLTISGAGKMDNKALLNMEDLDTGSNGVTIQVGKQVINVSFQTLKSDYFTTEQKKDENGVPMVDGNGDPVMEELPKDKQALYDQVKDDYIELQKFTKYEDWRDNIATDADKEQIENEAFDKAEKENFLKYLDNKNALNTFLKDHYDIYKYNQESMGNSVQSFNDWKEANFVNVKEKYDEYAKEAEENGDTVLSYDDWKTSAGAVSNLLFSQYEADYMDKSNLSESARGAFRVDEYLDKEYDKYKRSLSDPSTAAAKDIWKSGVTTEGSEYYDETVAKGAKRIEDRYLTGYQLDRSGWKNLKYNEYEAYKAHYIDTSEQASADYEASLNIDNDTIIDHFNTSAINNSVGAAQIKEEDGVVNIKVTYDSDGNANITAEKSFYEYEYEKEMEVVDGKLQEKVDANGDPVYVLNPDGTKKVYMKDGKPVYAKDANGKPVFRDEEPTKVDFSVTAAKGSKNDFALAKASSAVSQISNSTLISDLGVEANENGKYEFSINGVNFSFSGDLTVKEMMSRVNASSAGVKMTYSSLKNEFTITANEYGVNSSVKITGDDQNLLSAIGLTDDPLKYKQGVNLVVDINGQVMQSNGNTVEVDGNKFTFTGNKAYPEEFEVNIEKDYSAIKDVVKSFVEEYNKLIEDVYKLLDEKPDKDYYFLADADKEDLNLSEKQEEKWETKAKQGLLYHDSTISTAMTRLRMSLMGYVVGADGNDVSLASIGIKTASDYKEHGKLILDEDKFTAAIMERGDDIAKLFSDKENGIMVKFAEALEGAVGTTGDKGTLINRAGMATGTSATNNFIYNQMKRITSNISSLEKRYEKEQDRLWKKYSAMESMLGTLNSQSATVSSYFGMGMQ